MSQKHLPMRKLKQIARLKFEAGRTCEEIVSAVSVDRSTVQTASSPLSRNGRSSRSTSSRARSAPFRRQPPASPPWVARPGKLVA